ncbi:MAG TPA: RNA-binding protein [Saprospiraceae bacterium]|nr:RNA-binding protein [Saprospiraceae bacterium]
MKLFVAKLPQHITSERLKAMFEAYGQVVDAKIIMDRETNKSKCYGFVEMSDSSGGNAAIEHLNGTQMEGKEILVKESEPAPPRNDHGGGGHRSGGFRPSFNSGGNDRRSGGPRPDNRWNNDRPKSDRYNDNNDRNRRRYDDDYDDKPRRKRI